MPRPTSCPPPWTSIGEPIAAFLPALASRPAPRRGTSLPMQCREIVVMASRFWPRFGFQPTRKGRHPSWQPLSRMLAGTGVPSGNRVRRASGSEGAAPSQSGRWTYFGWWFGKWSSNKEIASSMNISESAVKKKECLSSCSARRKREHGANSPVFWSCLSMSPPSAIAAAGLQ